MHLDPHPARRIQDGRQTGVRSPVFRCNVRPVASQGLSVQCREAGDLREQTQTPQKGHKSAETKPGQDTEGQCSIAELIGRPTRLVSVFTV